MDNNWNQNHFKDEDLKKIVTHIHLCAYINSNNAGDEEYPPTNHWVVFCETSSTHSVRINMGPGYGSDGLRGKITISSKTYIYTNNAHHRLSLPVNGRTKIQDIIRVINKNGLQRYQFNPKCEGCRFWTYTLISYLEQEGIIESGGANQAWNAVCYYYFDPSGYEKREVAEGTFR
ncbi:hypothetical protein E4U54_007808 [Claviceps lovelessii]|nr:hypothetical protein E4U54_007808 [Claviceps lovelessii]